MKNINIVGIDLAKSSFHVRGANHAGKTLFNKKISRERLMDTVMQFPKGALIAMEACATSHYWGRLFEVAGFKVKLIAPQYVRPFVKSQKNDSADAQGIIEAASRAEMRTVPVKSVEQQDLQAMHRIRERHIRDKTALMNELRGLLMEYGVVIPKGKSALGKHVALVLESNMLTEVMRSMTRELYDELLVLEQRVEKLTKRIEEIAKGNDCCERLMTIPGIAEITSTALYAAVGHMNFKNGRQLAAFLGLVPRQTSTGGKPKLGRITKRGDSYVRKLLVHGARSVLKNADRRNDRYSTWAKTMRDTKGYTKGSVAVANRNARLAWAMMKSDVSFDSNFVPPSKRQCQTMVH
jgi:transposase